MTSSTKRNAMGVFRFDDTVVIECSMLAEARDGTEMLAYTHRLNTSLAPRHYGSDLEAIETPLLVLVGGEASAESLIRWLASR